jgi:hypothetical protein
VDAEQIEVAAIEADDFLDIVDRYKSSPAYQRLLLRLPRHKYTLEMDLLAAPGCRSKGVSDNVRLIFVNTVYYTRNLTFSYGEDSSFAGKVSVTAQGGGGAPAATFQPSTLPAGSGTNPAQTSAQSLLASLATMSGGPGAGGSLAIASSGNLALNKTFARPMVFALQHQMEECLSFGKGTPSCPVVPLNVPEMRMANQTQ